jgi:hypothetical protein
MAKAKVARSKSGKSKKPKAPKPAQLGEKIGKGVPPIHTRFQKGMSGNRKGRPKGSRNIGTIIMEAANTSVSANIDGKPRKITTAQATAMQLATKAARGDQASMSKFLDWIDEIEARAAAARPAQFPFGPEDLDVVRTIHARMKLCEPIGKGR